MSREMALVVVNDLQNQLAGLARAIITALDDGRVTPFEGFALGMRGMQLGSAIITLLQSYPPEVQKDVLYILEHGDIVLPETAA